MLIIFKISHQFVRRGILLGLIVLLGLFANDVATSGWLPRLALIYYMAYFFAGFLLADIYVNDWECLPKTHLHFDVISLFSWGAIAYCLYEPDYFRAVFPLLILAAYWGAFRGRISSWFFSQPIIYIIGGMCYTLYLYHFYIIPAVGNPALAWLDGVSNSLAIQTVLMLLLIIPVVLAAGAVLFVLFEKPFMSRSWFEGIMRHFYEKQLQ